MVSPVALSRAVPGHRARELGIFAGLAVWLVYTRFFWALHASHIALPPCPFYYLTGHPCPFCGGTRSFAYMWEGDISDAVRLYPLGPIFFVGSLAGTVALGASLVTRRSWSINLTSDQWRLLAIGAVAAIAVSWILKDFVLGN